MEGCAPRIELMWLCDGIHRDHCIKIVMLFKVWKVDGKLGGGKDAGCL